MTWRIEDVTVHYGDTVALDGVAMTIETGRIHAVIGGDGAGKSTLLKILVGLDLGQTGTITLPDQAEIGFVPSRGGIFEELTVAENMEFVADAHRLRGWKPRAEALLARAGLAEFGARISGRMSGGQRRKLAGAMALLSEPHLLVLDEVSTGLDPVSRMELWRLIAGAAAGGAAVVAATTYLDEAERAESVVLLDAGRVLGAGSPDSITTAVPGTITDLDHPTERSLAWRHGRRWRQWDPTGTPGPDSTVTLEDAAIVLELDRRRDLTR
jgi:ABC-type multidrug transport system ATPase subunit